MRWAIPAAVVIFLAGLAIGMYLGHAEHHRCEAPEDYVRARGRAEVCGEKLKDDGILEELPR